MREGSRQSIKELRQTMQALLDGPATAFRNEWMGWAKELLDWEDARVYRSPEEHLDLINLCVAYGKFCPRAASLQKKLRQQAARWECIAITRR
jgi:hypothetical protein